MNFHDLKNSINDLDRDQILSRLGLQTRDSTMEKVFTGMALVGTGVLLGVGVGLMLAPRSGSEIRDDLRLKLRQATNRAEEPVVRPNGAAHPV